MAATWGGRARKVRVWDVQVGRLLRTLAADPEEAGTVALSYDGTRVATGGVKGTVSLWDARTGARLQGLAAHDREVSALAFSHDGRFLASGENWFPTGGDWQGTVKVWATFDPGRGGMGREVPVQMLATDHQVSCLAFSPDGRQVAVGSPDGRVTVWNGPAA